MLYKTYLYNVAIPQQTISDKILARYMCLLTYSKYPMNNYPIIFEKMIVKWYEIIKSLLIIKKCTNVDAMTLFPGPYDLLVLIMQHFSET